MLTNPLESIGILSTVLFDIFLIEGKQSLFGSEKIERKSSEWRDNMFYLRNIMSSSNKSMTVPSDNGTRLSPRDKRAQAREREKERKEGEKRKKERKRDKEMRIWIFITRTHECSSRPHAIHYYRIRFNACIAREEPSECQKTNDQLSGELANASLLVCARASHRNRRMREERDRERRRQQQQQQQQQQWRRQRTRRRRRKRRKEEEERQNRFSLWDDNVVLDDIDVE